MEIKKNAVKKDGGVVVNKKKKARTIYTTEFKETTVQSAMARGIKKTAAELGIPEGTISPWIRQAKDTKLVDRISAEDMAEITRVREAEKEKDRKAKEASHAKEREKCRREATKHFKRPIEETEKRERIIFLMQAVSKDPSIRISVYCKELGVSRQAFYQFLERSERAARKQRKEQRVMQRVERRDKSVAEWQAAGNEGTPYEQEGQVRTRKVDKIYKSENSLHVNNAKPKVKLHTDPDAYLLQTMTVKPGLSEETKAKAKAKRESLKKS